MPALHAIPAASQCDEPWANGAGTTTLILREPDDTDWRIRISIARVERGGPFSELPGTRRILVPLDAAMTLRLADGRELRAARFETLRFEGSPAPTGHLPDGPTRDFNLMLRGGARGDATPCSLLDPISLPTAANRRWLVYVHGGRACLRHDGLPPLDLAPRDAVLVTPDDDGAHTLVEGAGEIILVKLYA